MLPLIMHQRRCIVLGNYCTPSLAGILVINLHFDLADVDNQLHLIITKNGLLQYKKLYFNSLLHKLV